MSSRGQRQAAVASRSFIVAVGKCRLLLTRVPLSPVSVRGRASPFSSSLRSTTLSLHCFDNETNCLLTARERIAIGNRDVLHK